MSKSLPTAADCASANLGSWRGDFNPGGIMRIGRNVEVRPLGGAPGCLAMIFVSIAISVLLTLVLNVLLR